MRSRTSSSAMPSSFVHSAIGKVETEDFLDFGFEADRVPLFGIGLFGDVALPRARRRPAAHIGDLVAHVVGRHDLLALLEDHLALVVEHVVVFEDVLAHLEIARFDLLLRLFERLVDPGMRDRFAFFETQRCRIESMRSEPKMRIRSSCRLRKNFEAPGSPWRPERPRSWLSMRRLSWRSVPIT
jgi:hypothetical protein